MEAFNKEINLNSLISAVESQAYHKSIRLKEYDYSSPGAYFLTLCTQNRACLFGEIIERDMILNISGEIVRTELLKTPDIRQELELDTYAIMPNHLHIIVWIKPRSGDRLVAHRGSGFTCKGGENKLKPKSLGAFVGGFKTGVTKRINEIRKTPGVPVWQANYYEHIIRNENDLNETREYILRNPLNWALDSENPGQE